MFGQLKLKKQFFEKKIENTKICCYQDLYSNTNSLNETDSLNQMRVFFDFRKLETENSLLRVSVSFTN